MSAREEWTFAAPRGIKGGGMQHKQHG